MQKGVVIILESCAKGESGGESKLCDGCSIDGGDGDCWGDC